MIACDRPGMRGSDYQLKRGFRDMPADILALANALGVEKFGLFGVSGGAGYVATCAFLIPQRLAAVVIASGAGPMGSPEALASLPFLGRLVWGLSARAPGPASLLFSLTRPRDLQDVSKIRQRMKRSMSPVESAVFEKPSRLEAFIASGVESMHQDVHGIAWDTHLCARPWDIPLEEIYFPVRLLHGESDRNVPVAVARDVLILAGKGSKPTGATHR